MLCADGDGEDQRCSDSVDQVNGYEHYLYFVRNTCAKGIGWESKAELERLEKEKAGKKPWGLWGWCRGQKCDAAVTGDIETSRIPNEN